MAESETLIQTARADLERPLDPDLTYFDATPSIETLAKIQLSQQRQSVELTNKLEHAMGQIVDLIAIAQKLIAANVDIRKKLIELEADMIKPEQRSALILPDHMRGN